MRSKHFLGSFVGQRGDGSDFGIKFGSLHRAISTEDEWGRRKEHFEEQLDKNKVGVLRCWNNRVTDEMSDFGKSALVMEIAKERHITKSMICEILDREGEFEKAIWHLREYCLTQKYGGKVAGLWKRFHGNKIAKTGNHVKIAAVIEKIAKHKDIGLTPYSTAKVLSNRGVYIGSSWATWGSEMMDDYGEIVGRLWDNRKWRVKSDDWSLCGVIESISKDTGGLVDPYVVTKMLADWGDVDLDPNTAYIVYAKYKIANQALELIRNTGPKTVKEVKEDLGVVERTAADALKTLYERNMVVRHIDFVQKCYYYLDDQEGMLKDVAPKLKLEEEIIRADKPYFTIPGLPCSANVARHILEELLARGKVVKLTKYMKPHLYVPVNGREPEDAKNSALKHKYSRILENIGAEGALRIQIKRAVLADANLCEKTVSNQLRAMEHYGLVRREGNMFFRVK